MANPSAAHEPSMEEILASIRQIISEDGGTLPDDSEAASMPKPDEPAIDAAPSANDQPAAEERRRTLAAAVAPEERPSPPKPASQAAPKPAEPKQAEPEARPPQPASAASQPRHESGRRPDASATPAMSSPRPTSAAPAASALRQQPAPQARQAPPQAGPEPRPAPSPQPTRQAEPAGQGQAASHRTPGQDRLLSPQADAAVSGAFGVLAQTMLAQNARTLEDLVGEILRPMLKDWLDDNLPPLVERLVREEIERVSRRR